LSRLKDRLRHDQRFKIKGSRAKCYKRMSDESTRGKYVSRNKTQEAMSIERIQGKTQEVKSSRE
jgi:hypothetical protein